MTDVEKSEGQNTINGMTTDVRIHGTHLHANKD